MNHAKIIERLLETGDPAIRYRIKREILGGLPSLLEMQALQQQIARKKAVVKVMSHPPEPAGGEGWIGTELHGVTGFDGGVRILLERGLEPSHSYLAAARDALIRRGDDYPNGRGTYGVLRAIDEAGRGGLRTMRAWLLALLGAEEQPIVSEEVAEALAHFEGLARLRSLDEVSTPYTGGQKNHVGHRVYKPHVRFPGGWHLPLLSATHSWRRPDTQDLLVAAFDNAVRLFPIPPQILKRGSHYVGPGNVGWRVLATDDVRVLSPMDFAFWIREATALGKVGVMQRVPHFRRHVDQVRELLADAEWVKSYRPHYVFRTMYGLSEDWRSPRRRENDVLFRLLLILHTCDALDVE